MKNIFFIITVLIVLTTVIVGTNPQMPKPINICGAKILVPDNRNIKNTDLKVENNDSVTDKNSVLVESTESVKAVQNVVAKNIKNNNNQKQPVSAKKLVRQKTQTPIKKPVKQPSPKTLSQSKKVIQKPVQPVSKTQSKIVVPDKTTPKFTQKKQAPVVSEKQLVSEQETIVWNKWRADIANSIGATTLATLKEKVEIGTTIKYSFNVDKNEQISNIVVSISKGPTSSGAQSAKSVIYKAIKSLNGKSILVFPKGTNRTSTTVVGAIELSDKTVKTDKNMFNDYETVTKQYYK